MLVSISKNVFNFFLVLVSLLGHLSILPAYSDSIAFTQNVVLKIGRLQSDAFSRETAVKLLAKIENNQLSLPAGWRSYLAATFALEGNDLRRYQKYMRLLKTEENTLYKLLAVTNRILDLIRRGKTRDYQLPLSPKLRKVCKLLKYPGVHLPNRTWTKIREVAFMKGLRGSADLVFRWQNSNEAILAFAKGLEFTGQYRLLILICQEIFDRYGTSTPSGKKAAKILTWYIEGSGPRSRYLKLMQKLGKKPRTEEEFWLSIRRM